jgi:hypothetical protein
VVSWLAVLFRADPARVPSWLTLTVSGLVAFVLARAVLTRTRDLAWARSLAAAAWFLWTWGWWALRQASEPAWGYPAALVRLDSSAVGLAFLSALVWWRGFVLASEPFPFQGDYLRWAVLRDLTALAAVTLAAALSGGPAAQAVWDRLALTVPLLLLCRLLTAALVQAQAVRLAYPEALAPAQWVLRAAFFAALVLALGAVASLAAGPALWPRLAQPVTWFFTLVVAVLVTVTVALAFLVWWALQLILWVLRTLARPGEATPVPEPPSLPELLRPQETLAAFALPSWLLQALSVLAGALLVLVLARLVARSVRRARQATASPLASEQRERIALDGSALLPRWRPRPPRSPAVRRGTGRPHDVRSAYRAALLLLADRGLLRRPEETPLAFAQRVAASLPRLLPAFAELTDRYLLVRYAERETPDDRAAALAAWQELHRAFQTRE